MTADSVDLEDCNDTFKEMVGNLFDDKTLTLLDADHYYDAPKLQPVPCPTNSFSDLKLPKYYDEIDPLNLETFLTAIFEDDPFVDCCADYKMRSCDLDMSLQISSPLDMEPDYFTHTVPPDLILPNPVLPIPVLPDSVSPINVKEEEDSGDEAVESIWSEVSELNDIKLLKFVDGGYLGDELVPIDELFKRKKRRKLTHLEFDHCYSQRPIEDEEDDDEYDYFNSYPYSPASSTCSDKTKGVKRSRSKKKTVKHIKIKQEIISSDEEEVDVETPCPISLVVPKITISLAPPPVKVPAKRGRKPKNKTAGQTVKKSNKNCPVSPRDLQAAIKQQKQKCYITKSGRVSNKISNSVETTPSTSTPSSLSNSRCTSDTEDSIDKRASHNMAERNRRQELTNLFQNVRKKVPAIERNTKASKVLILQSAASYIGELENEGEEIISQKQKLRAELEKKLAIVQSLKNSRGYSS